MSVTTETLDIDLPATLEGLRTGIAAIERHCVAAGLPRATLARTLTVFEEIFTNTVKYGYGGVTGGRIRAILAGADPLRLTLEDSAPPFNPTLWDASADLAAGLADRPIGRTGIALIMGLTRNVCWQQLALGNRLTVEIAVSR